jgi:hypothetical protein
VDITPLVISFETHVTIEPVAGENLVFFKQLCESYGYKVANLLMQKDREATAERSNKD